MYMSVGVPPASSGGGQLARLSGGYQSSTESSLRQDARDASGAEHASKDRGIPVEIAGGIRYTVPALVNPAKVRRWLKFRFRVGDVMTNRKVVLYIDGEPVLTKKRRVMAPGEMEELVLTKKVLESHPDMKSIAIQIEEDKG